MKWIKCNIPYGPVYSKGFVDSLTKRNLNKPGVLIKMKKKIEGRYTFLIGHINELRGGCDDCTMFNPEEIVEKYCIVWEDRS